MTTITLELPDDVAERAREEGLLTAQGLRELLEEATRIRRMKARFDAPGGRITEAPPEAGPA